MSATAFGLFLAELPFTVFEGELPTLISKAVTSIIKSYKKSFGLLLVSLPLAKYLFEIFFVGL